MISTRQWQLLAVVTLLGLGLRLLNLTGKSPWMDEVATTVYVMGNRIARLPVDQLISLNAALAPLTYDAATSPLQVAQNLVAEDTHPPVYFVLARLWTSLFAVDGEVAAVGVARSLPALISAATIPLTFWLGWLAAESVALAQIGAIALAVSPFSVAFAQEARQYALAILLTAASLCCLVSAVKHLQQRRPIPAWQGGLWVVLSFLGILTHYFFGLVLIAQGMVLAGLLWRQSRSSAVWFKPHWQRIYWTAGGTLLAVLLWSPVLLGVYRHPHTGFLRVSPQGWDWLAPLGQTLFSWIVALLWPATVTFAAYGWPVVIGTAPLMLVFALWGIPLWVRGVWHYFRRRDTPVGMRTVGWFLVAANLLFFAITYGLAKDITRGDRYKFVYYPALMLVASGGLAAFWTGALPFKVRLPLVGHIRGKAFVAIALTYACFSSLLAVTHLSLPKYYNPQRFVSVLQADSSAPVVLAGPYPVASRPTTYGIEFLSVVWEIHRHFHPGPDDDWAAPPQFGLFREDRLDQLALAVTQLPGSVDLWTISIPPENLQIPACSFIADGNRGSYRYYHYACQQVQPGITRDAPADDQ